MEIIILDNILHGTLKPWKVDISNNRRFTEIVRNAKAIPLSTLSDIFGQVSYLLTDFPIQQKVLVLEPKSPNPLQPLRFDIELPKYYNAVTHFYNLLITAETLRFYNAFLYQAGNWSDIIDVQYNVNQTLTNIRVLAKQTGIELKDRDYSTPPDEQSDIVHFALFHLKHSLIRLYFSIQEHFKDSLDKTTTLEDFYLLDLEESISNLIQLKPVILTENHKEGGHITIKDQDRIWFGFKDDPEKLTYIVTQLCFQIVLVNEDLCTAEDLLKVLTSKSLIPGCTKIHIGCETKHFRYCIDKLQPYFSNLSLSNIEKSKIFFSINDNPITANNLSASSSKNKLEPKEKATIDRIFNQVK